MRAIGILGILIAILTTASVVTSANACPSGYASCGGACCPRR